MRLLLKNNKFNYTIQPLIDLKKLVNLKTCYRKELIWLKYKISLTNSLSNRLVYESQFYRSYKNTREYYIFTLRANFTENLATKYIPYFLDTFDNKNFLSIYFQKQNVKEFDFLLYWRGSQTNSLFNIKTTIKKKRKKISYKHTVYFIKPDKRILFVWKWLNIFIRSINVKNVPRKLFLIKGFENFFMAPESSQAINNFKLQIYKLKLLRVT